MAEIAVRVQEGHQQQSRPSINSLPPIGGSIYQSFDAAKEEEEENKSSTDSPIKDPANPADQAAVVAHEAIEEEANEKEILTEKRADAEETDEDAKEEETQVESPKFNPTGKSISSGKSVSGWI